MKILVASDLSGRSERAMARAFALAREQDAELVVLHVVDAQLPEELRSHCTDWARRTLGRELEGRSTATGVRASADVRAGDAKLAINDAADAADADLLLLGFHDRTRPEARFGDTTAGRVLRQSRRPLLLVQGPAATPYRRVVVGVDFSVFSRLAIRQSFTVAPGARFHLLHAYHVAYQGLIGASSHGDQVAYERRLELDAFLADEMTLLRRRALELGVQPEALETLLREGSPPDVLLEECARLNADLLVIGTHGRTGLSRAVLGSVAADILSAPPCDVLVVPAQ